MSNVIPIVSSSPPPLDDDGDFKWDDDDDDDDEYGNFACAPAFSATHVNSDSSFKANWSNSETSLSAQAEWTKTDVKPQPAKKDLSRPNLNTSENVLSGSQSSNLSGSRSNGAQVTSGADDDFQDFAHFGTAEFSDRDVQTYNEKPEDTAGSQLDRSSPAAQNNIEPVTVDSAAEVEDDFQDFAQFNSSMENGPSSIPGNPEFPQDEGVAVSDNGLTKSSISDKTAGSLSPDQNSETCDSQPAMKNIDSIYGSVSTVDSGVFSADLSPCNNAGDASDVCLDIDKAVVVTYKDLVAHQAADSTSTGESHDDSESLEISEQFKETKPSHIPTSNDSISKNKSSSNITQSDTTDNHPDGSQFSKGDNWRSEYNQSDFGVSEKCNKTEEKPSVKEFLNEEEHKGDEGKCYRNHELLTRAHEVQISEQSGLPLQYNSEVPFSESSAVIVPDNEAEQEMSHSGRLPNLVSENNRGHIEDVENSASLAENTSQQDHKIIAADDEDDETVVYEEDLCNIDSSADAEARTNSHLTAADDSECDNKSCDIVSESDCISEVVGEGKVTHVFVEEDNCDLEHSIPAKSFLSEVDALKDKDLTSAENDDEDDDQEFGEFRSQIDEDCNDVPPITFRTSICEDDINDDEEDDFTFNREKPPAFNDEDDNDDDFGAFGTATKNDVEDEFGEFDSAHALQPNFAEKVAHKSSDDDEFGDFGRSDPAEEDAGWADFGTATPAEGFTGVNSTAVRQTMATNTELHNKVQKLQKAIVSCFPESPLSDLSNSPQAVSAVGDGFEKHSEDSDHSASCLKENEEPLALDVVVELGLSNALEAKQQTWTVVQHPAKKDPKVRLWGHLKDVDNCSALMFGWHASHCSKEVYATLHIDTQNILFTQKKQAVPFFASGLGILEPIRGGGGGVIERKKEKSNIPAIWPTLLETSKATTQQTSTTQDIPPVDFDWSTSGLTNPLTANTLDLDFLVVQGSDSYEKTSDEWDWVFKAESQEPAPSALQPLEEILKNTTPTAKLATNEVLSPEAARVLEKMRDLSFMQSRVLMFPVKQ